MPAEHHPHCQSRGGGQAGRQDEQDDKQLLIALVARQMREQQLARASYKISGHSVKMVFLVAMARRSLCATIGAMDSCHLSPENDPNETHCGGSKSTKPVENKMGGSTERRSTAFSKLSPHRIANTKRAERMKSARVAKQNVQQHGFDRKLMPALFYYRVPVHYISVPLVSWIFT